LRLSRDLGRFLKKMFRIDQSAGNSEEEDDRQHEVIPQDTDMQGQLDAHVQCYPDQDKPTQP